MTTPHPPPEPRRRETADASRARRWRVGWTVTDRYSAILTERDLWALINERGRRAFGDDIARFDPTTVVGDEVAGQLGDWENECTYAGTGESYRRIEKITLHALADEDTGDDEAGREHHLRGAPPPRLTSHPRDRRGLPMPSVNVHPGATGASTLLDATAINVSASTPIPPTANATARPRGWSPSTAATAPPTYPIPDSMPTGQPGSPPSTPTATARTGATPPPRPAGKGRTSGAADSRQKPSPLDPIRLDHSRGAGQH